MTTHPENKDKAGQKKIAKDELSEKELEKATGGAGGSVELKEITIKKDTDKSSVVIAP